MLIIRTKLIVLYISRKNVSCKATREEASTPFALTYASLTSFRREKFPLFYQYPKLTNEYLYCQTFPWHKDESMILYTSCLYHRYLIQKLLCHNPYLLRCLPNIEPNFALRNSVAIISKLIPKYPKSTANKHSKLVCEYMCLKPTLAIR